MDWLQFTAAIVGNIAWPTVAVLLIIILRKHIGALADRLDKFSFGGAEFSFKELLATGAEIIQESAVDDTDVALEVPYPRLPRHPTDLGVHRTRDALQKGSLQGRELWSTTGRGQIINSYERIDDELRQIAEILDLPVREGKVILELLERKLVTHEIVKLYVTLKNGRDLIAHGRALPSETETAEYVRQAAYLQVTLQLVKEKLKK